MREGARSAPGVRVRAGSHGTAQVRGASELPEQLSGRAGALEPLVLEQEREEAR